MHLLCDFIKDMDVQRGIWCVVLILGILLSIHGWMSIVKNHRREVHYAKAAVFEFLSCWILYIPHEFFNDLSDNPCVLLRICESVFTALLKSFNVYAGNGYERVEYIGHIYFSSIYNIVRVFANIALVLFIGGFILNFLNGPLQKIRFYSHKKYKTFVFSECNYKTLAIAQSIMQSSTLPRKKKVVFACAGKSTPQDKKEELVDAVFLKENIDYVIQQLKKKSEGLEIFLFEAEEEDNLDQLEEVCSKLKNYEGCKIKLFLELMKTPWSLYDDVLSRYDLVKNPSEESKIIVNFVRSEENFIYNHLLEYSIFERTIKEAEKEVIKILIVGEMNDRNLEFLKAVLHLGQMPGYVLKIYVIEAAKDRDRLYQVMPEVKDECNEIGNAIYSLHFWEGINYKSAIFDNIISEKIPDFTFAFVNIGDDLENVRLAMRINAFCYRKKRALNSYTIQANVSRQEICNKWNPELLVGIEVIGDQEKIYDYNFITMSKIEEATKAIHDVRQENKKKEDNDHKIQTWEDYCNNEYNRHSVYARTLSFKYKIWLIDKENKLDSSDDEYKKYEITGKDIPDENGKESNIWKIYEHMRWNMYTRILGYSLTNGDLLDENGKLDKKVRNIAFVHNDLVTFYELADVEQKKDSLSLTPAIVDILKKI